MIERTLPCIPCASGDTFRCSCVLHTGRHSLPVWTWIMLEYHHRINAITDEQMTFFSKPQQSVSRTKPFLSWRCSVR